jgi:predicted amidohydrolase
MIQTRAYENHVFIIYADLCGEENDTPYHGGSVIAAPDGQVLARAGDEEALLMTALDPARYASAELDPYLQDRRPEIYASK